ncbi:MAG: IS3 family transposase [Candidatus Moranbacteria bacterium]|nr:IS3 family transposase [Candidatus Moranbacteria bacterium]
MDIKKIGIITFHRAHNCGSILQAYAMQEACKKYGLVPKAAKKYKPTTNSNYKLPVAPNLLEQNFTVNSPNTVWVSDFTYIYTETGWQYLAVVIDLYSRRVVGWSVNNRMTKKLVIDAMDMAIKNRKPPAGLIAHSDRGSQYCSKDYQKLLKKYKIRPSMSKKGDCYDNACAETFFHSFKVEWIYGEKFTGYDDLRASALEYIEIFYNRQRLHSYLGYKTPAEFEKVA